MHDAGTIVAVSTPPGRACRAMVRLSGPDALATLATLADGVSASRGCGAVRLRVPFDLPVLVACYLGPRSYTGEDVAEVFLPGNPTVIDRVLRALCAAPGVRMAGPGEFTARAYFHGRLSLEQAEGVGATIAAATDAQADAARALLDGRAGEAYRTWADELTTLLALVEAGIDFTDQEDVQAIAPADLRRRLADLGSAIAGRMGRRRGGDAALPLPRVVLAGRPNAGKSTLFNALLGRRRAVTSAHAGTTRDVIEEHLDLTRDLPGAGVVCLADLAGVDAEALGPADRAAQFAALDAVAAADVVAWCDPTGRFDDAALPATRGTRLFVRTFADRCGESGPSGVIPVCGLDGWNLAALRRAIAQAVCNTGQAPLAALLPRHRLAMEDAATALREAEALLPPESGRLDRAEEVAHALRTALDALGTLCGRVEPDAVLGRVFATFCVGK